MGEPGEKYHASDVMYEPDTAEYDAHDFQYQIVDLSGDIIALFSDNHERDKILHMMNAFAISDAKRAVADAIANANRPKE